MSVMGEWDDIGACDSIPIFGFDAVRDKIPRRKLARLAPSPSPSSPRSCLTGRGNPRDDDIMLKPALRLRAASVGFRHCQIRFGRYSGVIMDPNYWGLWCVPLGIVLCFGPALLVAAFGSKHGINVEERGKKRD